MQRLLAPLLPLILLSVGACDLDDSHLDPRDEAEADPASVEAVPELAAASAGRTLLREVQLSDTHVVRFWALADGSGAVEESFHADLDRGSVLPQDDRQRTLAELHRAVLPGEEVPAEVLAVDEYTALLASDPIAAGDSHTQLETVQPLSAVEPEPSAACAGWDWVNDRQWFLNNFCNEGLNRDCVANWTAINSWRHETSWFKVWVFNQSFEAAATVKGGHQNCWWDFWDFETECEWIQEFNQGVPNRGILGWYWTGTNRRYTDIVGHGACARVGMAQLWNTPGQTGGGNPGGGDPNPNPTGPCNYVGEFCCAQQNVAGFYCDAVHDPQLYCQSGTCQH